MKSTGDGKIGRKGEGETGREKDERPTSNIEHRTSNRKNIKHRRGGGVEVGPGVVLLIAELCRG